MDFNYLEVQHDIAGMPYKPSPKFYPTEREARIAEKERRAIHGKLLLWTQAGSSVHKFWPHQDTAIARILLHYPDWHVALTGDNVCRLLEMGWEKTPRIIELSGKIGVRQTLALAEVADMVVGPETGVLNAVSHLQVPKIVFLSHSSVTNLTRDWINTIPLEAHGCLCYPCHQMHTDGWKDCPKGPNGTGAWCQEQISPEAFMDAFEKQARLLTKGAGG
jgi:ADP-heptose:LPS heptosyltransferase